MIAKFGDLQQSIKEAQSRIQSYLQHTALVFDDTHHVWLKCEQDQTTGSFKWRGALAKLSTLKPGNKIVTASTGNHGLAVATAAKMLGLHPIVFVPSSAAVTKVKKIDKTGAEMVRVDGDSLGAELAGKEFAQLHNLEWISPYNDIDVISGQGTIGMELTDALQHIDRVYVTVGGGGLVSGIATWLKGFDDSIEVIGCQPANSREMYLSILAGRVVNDEQSSETLSDGSAGPLEEDSITFPLCSSLIDRFLLISEKEIELALKYLHSTHGMTVEGSAGVAMAGAMKDNQEKKGTAIVILCGGNIDPNLHSAICRLEMASD